MFVVIFCLSCVYTKAGSINIYSAARQPTQAGFEHHMGLLSATAPKAHAKLDEIPPETWAHYASRKNVCFDQVTSNPAETVNSMLGEVKGVLFPCRTREESVSTVFLRNL